MLENIVPIGLLEDEAIELDASALELAALDHPGVDLAPYLRILAAIAERLAAKAEEAQTLKDRAKLLAHVIAREHGFHGDRETYEDPANADLIRVIDRRRGLPVSLAIIHVATARRLGWQADVLNTPGHVLVRLGGEAESVLMDVFEGGTLLDAPALAALLRRVLGRDVRPSAEHLQPMPNRAVLVRLLMNQAVRAEAGGNAERALTLYHRMTVISPTLPHGWWERARLEHAAGQMAAARRSLSAMLEITRDPNLRMQVAAALDSLSGAPG